MAVSDDLIMFLGTWLVTIYFLYLNKVRLWRIIGCFALIVIGLVSVMLGDNIFSYLFFGINLIIAGAKLFEDIPELWGK